MADWTEDSNDENDCISGDEDYEWEQHEEAGSTSVPVVAQTIRIIGKESLLPVQRTIICKVMDILEVKERHARMLLIHYRWDVDSLLAALVERGIEWLFSKVGVAIKLESTKVSVITICNVCTEEGLQEKETTTMDCGHTFCNVCWTEHFLVKINEGHSKRIKCMDPQCNIICDEDVVRKLVTVKDPEAAQRFNRFLFESYIDDNNNVKWCPSVPNCGNALRVEEFYCEIECICGQQFCFNCLAEPHSPCSCLIWELWDKKCHDDSETFNWIAVNTKPCPKCRKNVEKIGGCNLVSCVCGEHFCWLCGGATRREHTWDTISGHTCGRYKEDQEEIEKAERDWKRYTHYYSRWKVHKDSLKIEAENRKLLEKKIIDFESKEFGVRDYSWLKSAPQSLFRSRHALSYSYPFAFHMFGDDILKDTLTATEKKMKQIIFEDLQQQLEGTVESLSKFLEGSTLDEESVQDIRVQVINLSVLADSWCLKMYDFIENDLLRSLELTLHKIAPYNSNSNGLWRASDPTVLII